MRSHSVRVIRILILCLFTPFASETEAVQERSFRRQVVNRATGAPVDGATVMIVGVAGTVRTDAEGRFTFEPRPNLPFQVVVVLPSGAVAHPVDITRLEDNTVIPVDPLAEESLTVVGAAPSVTVAPAAATTLLSAEQIEGRAPENLLQALEMVPGVNQVSEGHAAVPAIGRHFRAHAPRRAGERLSRARQRHVRRRRARALSLQPSTLSPEP